MRRAIEERRDTWIKLVVAAVLLAWALAAIGASLRPPGVVPGPRPAPPPVLSR